MTKFWEVFLNIVVPLLLMGVTGYWAGRTLESIKWENREKRRQALAKEVQRHLPVVQRVLCPWNKCEHNLNGLCSKQGIVYLKEFGDDHMQVLQCENLRIKKRSG
jgi:hypothetical protein